MRMAYILVDKINFEVPAKLFLFTSIVFGFYSVTCYCYPKIACWLAFLGNLSILLFVIVIIYSIKSLAII
ncbi:hypothetical protein [Archaeoglobus sp.]